MEIEADAECPAADDVDPKDLSGGCGSDIRQVTGEGTDYEDVGWGWENFGQDTPG